MQQYHEMADKNGVVLVADGPCQFCGSATERGVHECVELFSLGVDVLDFSNPENHYFRFLVVDAHTLQHPEIQGRWNNHFHLTHQHLMYHHNIAWNYKLSPRRSDYLKAYKRSNASEHLAPPSPLYRGSITITDLLDRGVNEEETKRVIVVWGREVYDAWSVHYSTIAPPGCRLSGSAVTPAPRGAYPNSTMRRHTGSLCWPIAQYEFLRSVRDAAPNDRSPAGT